MRYKILIRPNTNRNWTKKLRYFTIQLKLLIVITLRQRETDNITQMLILINFQLIKITLLKLFQSWSKNIWSHSPNDNIINEHVKRLLLNGCFLLVQQGYSILIFQQTEIERTYTNLPISFEKTSFSRILRTVSQFWKFLYFIIYDSTFILQSFV